MTRPRPAHWLSALSLLLAACGPAAPTATAPSAKPTEPTASTGATSVLTQPPPTNTAAPTEIPAESATAASSTTVPTPAPTEPPELLADPILLEFAVPAGAHPHDVAPAVDGGVWYTAQHQGALGYLDPDTGATEHIALGSGSAPHGVIVGPDGAPWITDSGLNAIVRVEPATREVTTYPLPLTAPNANLNTAAFDGSGVLWFTGQAGYYGRLDPATGVMDVRGAPRGRGPYGITATPAGDIFYASLAGNHIAAVDVATGDAQVIEPPTAGQGARRVWSDSQGRIWVSEWNAGQLGVYTPETGQWREWPLPGENPQAYAVYVDEHDHVWVSDFGANAMHRFDPRTETFLTLPLASRPANVRQLLGRPGEVWLAASGVDQLILVKTTE